MRRIPHRPTDFFGARVREVRDRPTDLPGLPESVVGRLHNAGRAQTKVGPILIENGVKTRRFMLSEAQCSNLTGITSPDNQTRSWLTSQNNQKVVLTGIQYHFGPGAETGPDRPSRALEPSDRHLHTPKQPFHFKYHLFSCRIRPSPAVSGRFRPYSYVFQSIGAVRCRGSRLNTAPLELKRIKLESGIRKYQLTIPLSKSIKEWSIPL